MQPAAVAARADEWSTHARKRENEGENVRKERGRREVETNREGIKTDSLSGLIIALLLMA